MKTKYIIQTKTANGWFSLPGTAGTKQYCEGYLDAIRDMIPHQSARIFDTEKNVVIEEISEKKGLKLN